MTMQQYCLRWNNHQPNFISVFSSLLNSESLVDVTLAAEGRHLQAHKVVLSACSSYFQSLFTVNPCKHPIVILKDVKFKDLKVIVDFMYYGEVNVSQEQLPHILKTAEMLKIKGLAEIPVEPSSLTKSQTNSSERAELLTSTDPNWTSEVGQRSTLSPTTCPLSPSSKRKRLRKSSTGSGSGSTERIIEEPTTNEVTVTSPGGSTLGTLIKPDPGGFSSAPNTPLRIKQHSSDSDTLPRGNSHESADGDVTHQITLVGTTLRQVPQQEQPSAPPSVEPQSVEAPPNSSCGATQQQSVQDRPSVTTQTQMPQQPLHQQNQHMVMGTKRGRILMRQPRIKRESDSNQNQEGDGCSPQFLSIPFRVERQCSDPLPSASPPPGNLLSVPGHTLVKQHSHPLLPSQTQQQSHGNSSQILMHQSSTTSTGSVDAERAVSPVVVVSDCASSGSENTTLRAETAPSATATLRVRTDELKRSSSSPQTGTRLSHCPVVRPGPALGCNYCWNTVDNHGRILRRKTKYHCPECQTNLCIVPCFQEYHERHVSGQTDPLALTSSVMRTIFPKTTSM
ncbi:protein tramtrack, alpha isoform isoform X2 [Agrilus planipennis]|uniref:Protein tramtrack, alpha isoform isoform X2 n=1 Tax=Agrilus planipennis TaxID=224129 RepID=A0A1W4XSJ9_AGRPL|nr:protein tramtrack, alpha isoform isoform X2 [Agrilus planipennis]